MIITKKQTITELHKGLINKDFTAMELTEAYLKNLETQEKEIHAFVNTTKLEALAAAKIVDEKIAKGEKISLIAGIPAAIKDNFNWLGTKTTASSKILENYISPYNATVTQKLLENDAVFVGKTNMDAFAHGSSTETSDFGVTKNPFDLSRVAGGSSGGSSAAVAMDMCVYAIGSETAGSVRGPAAWCNLYGFAPTFGRFSRYGVVAMGSSLDRPGILANSALDCALVGDMLSGKDSHDATSIPEGRTNWAEKLSAENTKIKIGIPKHFLDPNIDKETVEMVKEVIKKYEKLGATIIELDLLDPKYSMAVYTIVMRSEVSSNLARIDGIRYGFVSDKIAENILDQISWNRGEGFGNEARQRSMGGAYALSSGYYDAYYKKAQKVRTLIIEDFKKAFQKVDLIMGPTMPGPAPKLGVTKGNPLFGDLSDLLAEPSALAGLPCISVPIGFNKEGLSIGMQIFGPQLHEQEVLDAAYLFETKLSK